MDAPAVAVTRDGRRVTVAWMDTRSGHNDRTVYWTTGAPGAFSPETPLPDDPGHPQSHPSLAGGEDGVVHAAWEDRRSGVQRIYYTSTRLGGKNLPVSVESEGDAAFPSVAAGRVIGIAYESGGNVVFRTIRP